MATRRDELAAAAARLFAERGYHGTSMADLADAMGVQKGSLYSLTESKQELLVSVTREGAAAFHGALDGVSEHQAALERIRLALRAHLAVVAAQVDAATVFTREWRFLEEPERTAFRAERRRYEERWRELLREAAERGALRADLDADAAVLLVLSAANWAYAVLKSGSSESITSRFGVGERKTPVSTAGHPKFVTAFRPLVTPGPIQIGVYPWFSPWLASPMKTTGEVLRTTASTPLSFKPWTTESCSGSAAVLLIRVW